MIAEMEREIIRERVVAGVAAARHRGRRIGRRPRYVDREAARELRATGMSFRQIAARLGLPTSVVFRALTDEGAPGAAPVPKGSPQ
jgi:DNA invertase Pin-like site-specific DNA recombinase